jgi:DEAD/DEAH box helicase domain-containing protein
MIPSVVAAQVRRGVEEFLLTTFPVTSPFFAGRLEEFLATPSALFRGPYVSLKLPFLTGDSTRRDFPHVVPDGFLPHRHQQQAWKRLSFPGAQSTLVATGTGSGKTECFLFPILDYCYQRRGEPGIKAIIVYPMNALATDQARRLARAIHGNPDLRGQVTAGLYIGGRTDDGAVGSKQMAEEQVITDRDTLRLAPPDVLLTNYKMLDYLLIRPADHALWQHNRPESLKYFVVDELHTFDGAQGADLACLIRRIKERVRAPEGHLCCVGTSATLGEEAAFSNKDLLDYAETVFGERFEPEAIIGETLQTPDEFLSGQLVTRFAQPGPEWADRLAPHQYQSVEDYIRAQYQLWFDRDLGVFSDDEWQVRLTELLKGHAFFRNLLIVLANRAVEASALVEELRKVIPTSDHPDQAYLGSLLDSFLALLSLARVPAVGGLTPLVNVRCQLWLRELRRMVGHVAPGGGLAFADDLKPDELAHALPLIHCRECGIVGWGALVREAEPRVTTDLRAFYNAYFRFSPNICFIFPGLDFTASGGQREFQRILCTACMRVFEDATRTTCPHCGAEAKQLLDVGMPKAWRHREARDGRPARREGSHDCPSCGGRNSLTILGSRAASLTAVIIAQLFSSPFNDDKKLLAFSDSVQDASHRAGFFAARTFQFNFRSALQKVVEAACGDIPFTELHDRFIDHWHQEMTEERFIATFLPVDMAWLDDYDTLRHTGALPAGSTLLDSLHRRLDWEVWSEYGFDARIGRTLEKTGSSTLAISQAQLSAAVAACFDPLCNEIGELRDLERERLTRFLTGIIVALKNKGGIAHAELGRYIDAGGNSYLLGKRLGLVHMPNFGKGSRAPVLVTDRGGTRFNTWVRASSNASVTWYEDWLVKCLAGGNPAVGAFAREVFELVVPRLVAAGVLFERPTPRGTVWGLSAELFAVTSHVSQLRCGECSFAVSAADADVHLLDGGPCLRYRCPGQMRAVAPSDDYYRRLYRHGDVARVFAQEHTGLLDRTTRERVEAGFIHNDRPGDPNLLSCTPTLEMGINIGDLSSLALCSVPPKPSNYVQRVGRAGRRDGNAFVLAVANARPHDLFFFFEPEEMIQGHVEPPGCFINASAVLERQFTGFVFDRWVETGLDRAALPLQLRPVLDQVERGELKSDAFPQTFLAFFDTNRTALESGFLGMFGDRLEEFARNRLLAFSRGTNLDVPSLTTRLTEGLQEQAKERKSLANRLRKLNARISDLDKEPGAGQAEEERKDELRQEKSATNAVIRGINERYLLNFFTDEGLLPNYAFPESGVVLRSVIYRKNPDATDSERRYETRSYTYERPAAVAISELAPANSFYAEGRKLLIDQVNMDLSEVERWRFCDSCNHMEREGITEPSKSCPRCGSPLWADEGQSKAMLRMRQVIATCSERESRSYDESDDREPEFFHKNLFVLKNDQDITAAWYIDKEDVPFGFEFFRKVTLREVNFGKEHGERGAVRIGGQEIPDSPFVVCRSCGKVQGVREPVDHAVYCPYRDNPAREKFLEACFLYREFTSEAVRMLLPVAAFDADRLISSFVAALDLGLRLKFKGDPGHLRTTVYDEPIPGSDVRKRFLVLYDGVPGGTGYLKELMQDSRVLMEVFQQAYDVMAACDCQHDPEKDGCYRCLLAYRGRHHSDNTSRQAAMGLLKTLLDNRQHLKATDRIDRIRLNSLLESELEGRFIEAVRRWVDARSDGRMSQQVVNGKPGWYLRVGELSYLIEPQVPLGLEHGVRVPSRADFVVRPERVTADALPIAVFTDGFEFHADPGSGNQRLGVDTAQRLAIVRSGRYRVWSLTWDDVEGGLRADVEPVEQIVADRWSRQQGLLSLMDPVGLVSWSKARKMSSLDLLLLLLSEPLLGWRALGLTTLASMLDSNGLASFGWATTARTKLVEDVSLQAWPGAPTVSDECLSGILRYPSDAAVPAVVGFVFGDSSAVRSRDLSGLVGTFRLCEESAEGDVSRFKRAWRTYWRLMNQLQFSDRLEIVSSLGLQEGRYGHLLEETLDLRGRQAPVNTMMAAMMDLASPDVRPLIEALGAKGLKPPEVGYELIGPGVEIEAEAELAWPQLKLAVLTAGQIVTRDRFVEAGWQTWSVEELSRDPLPLVLALGGAVR